jgi:hypothetical protein
MNTLCDEALLQSLVQDMQSGAPQEVTRVDALLAQFPQDARLHFLRGSMLVGDGRLIEGHDALSRAVALAPDFAIARFQLGFFQLTSGEAENALETWGRLDRLPDGHYLREFVDGLRCLIRDDFLGAMVHLRAGIALNHENAPQNGDMQLIIDQCQTLLAKSEGGQGDEAVSETSLILQRFSGKKDQH